MLIDCDRCSARAVRCDSCVVGLMLGPPAARPADVEIAPETPTVTVDLYTAHAAQFDTAERRALAALASAGLIPPLRREESEKADTTCDYVLTERESLAG
jgi:hypothetical protein